MGCLERLNTPLPYVALAPGARLVLVNREPRVPLRIDESMHDYRTLIERLAPSLDQTQACWLALRNEPTVHLIEAGQLNTYDVLVADEVVFTETALAGEAREGHRVGELVRLRPERPLLRERRLPRPVFDVGVEDVLEDARLLVERLFDQE